MFSHMVLEGANRLSNVFEIRKIRTFVLNSLPAVHDVFVLAVQTVLDVMTITCHLSYNLAGWFQGEGTDRALFPVFSTLPSGRPCCSLALICFINYEMDQEKNGAVHQNVQ